MGAVGGRRPQIVYGISAHRLAGEREALFAWGGLIHEYVGVSAENNYVDRIFINIGQP